MSEVWRTVVGQLRLQYATESPELAQFNAFVECLVSIGNEQVFEKAPTVGGQDLDLVALYNEVMKRGGYSEVESRRLWQEVGTVLGLEINASHALTLKVHFMRYLNPYVAQHTETHSKVKEEQLSFKESNLQQNASLSGMVASNQSTISPSIKRAKLAPSCGAADMSNEAGGSFSSAQTAPFPISQMKQERPAVLAPVISPPINTKEQPRNQEKTTETLLPDHFLKELVITHENFTECLLSGDSKKVIAAVNLLLELTADAEKDFLFIDYAPDLLDAIVSLMEKTNPCTVLVSKNCAKMSTTPLGELADSCWEMVLEKKGSFDMEKISKETLSLRHCLLSVVRNAACSVANEQILAYHTRLIAQLTSEMAIYSPRLVNLDALQIALETIAQLARHIDVTGRRRPFEDVTMEDCLDALAPSHIKADRAAGDSTAAATIEYVSTVLQIFPQLKFLIFCEERPFVLCALETFSKLSQVETNAEIFTHIPDNLLRRLVELLYTPATGFDALIPESDHRRPMTEYGRALLTTDENIDVEVRDNILEILSTLSELSVNLRRRICSIPYIIPVLLRIFGAYSRSREVPKLAASILQSLAQVSTNAPYFQAEQEMLYLFASKDDLIADLVCNTLCEVYHPPGGTGIVDSL